MTKSAPRNIPDELVDLIKTETKGDLLPGLSTIAEVALARHGDSVRAILFYGSCLRASNVSDGLADLYLLVDDYRSAYSSRALPFFNKLLPPNVFYLEVPFEGQILRAKYAVLSISDFQMGTRHWFHSYLWGRFCQKSSLVYAVDESVASQVHESMAAAVITFLSKAVPQMKNPFTARDLWAKGLSLSYSSELRTEQSTGAVRLFDADPDYYESLTRTTMPIFPSNEIIETNTKSWRFQVDISPRARRINDYAWLVRSIQGKVLSVLRLLKGLFTFQGGVDYILWKVERHSGVRIEVNAILKKIPPVAVVVILWRLYRKDAFR